MDMPEHDGLGLLLSAHDQPPQSTIAHVGMGTFSCDTTTVDCLSLDQRHATTPAKQCGA